jgi:hypothetical protein
MSQFHRLAQENIVKATHHAKDGRHKLARKHLAIASNHAEAHVDSMKQQKRTQEDMDEYKKHFQTHVDRVEGHMKPPDNTQKSDDDKCECKKCGQMKKMCKCGYMNKIKKKKTLKKNEKVMVGKPKADERYNYKHLKDLHPDDRKAAERKFGITDLGHYKYPVDKLEGRLVHGTRMKHNEPVAPKADMSYMLPEHKEGAAIRVHSGDHAGTFGVVTNPSPYHPDKLAIQTGPGTHNKIYVPHTHIEAAKGSVAKAVKVLNDIRHRLGA